MSSDNWQLQTFNFIMIGVYLSVLFEIYKAKDVFVSYGFHACIILSIIILVIYIIGRYLLTRKIIE